MVTVKHVDDNGRETLETFERTTFDADANVLTGHGGTTGDKIYNSGRHAFVMNEFGKTVGAYNFRAAKKQ